MTTMSARHVADQAARIMTADRMDAYGHPLDNLSRIGRLWAALLDVDEITPEQVALCMVAVKLSREVHAPALDNTVDGIGYLLAMHEARQERARRAAP